MIRMAQAPDRGAAEATALLGQSVDLCLQGQSSALVQSALEVATALSCARREWQTALEFWSWAEAYARHSGLRRDPADERFLQPFVAQLSARQGAAAFNRALQSADTQAPDVVLSRIQAWLSASAAGSVRRPQTA